MWLEIRNLGFQLPNSHGIFSKWRSQFAQEHRLLLQLKAFFQWEFQDPKMEVLYHIRSYKATFCGDIPLHRPYIGLIYGRYLQWIGSWNGHWFFPVQESKNSISINSWVTSQIVMFMCYQHLPTGPQNSTSASNILGRKIRYHLELPRGFC